MYREVRHTWSKLALCTQSRSDGNGTVPEKIGRFAGSRVSLQPKWYSLQLFHPQTRFSDEKSKGVFYLRQAQLKDPLIRDKNKVPTVIGWIQMPPSFSQQPLYSISDDSAPDLSGDDKCDKAWLGVPAIVIAQTESSRTDNSPPVEDSLEAAGSS